MNAYDAVRTVRSAQPENAVRELLRRKERKRGAKRQKEMQILRNLTKMTCQPVIPCHIMKTVRKKEAKKERDLFEKTR